jgi:uncharacterized protein YjiS (DUF1127 family)
MIEGVRIMTSKSSLATLTGAVSNPTLTLATAFKLVASAVYRWQQRSRLAQLDDRMLRDMGLTRGDVYREISKSVFRD